jgi:hypothetical protein
VIARKFLSIRPQADLVQQALAVDGAIACLSSNLFIHGLNADRAPHLKRSVIRPLLVSFPHETSGAKQTPARHTQGISQGT